MRRSRPSTKTLVLLMRVWPLRASGDPADKNGSLAVTDFAITLHADGREALDGASVRGQVGDTFEQAETVVETDSGRCDPDEGLFAGTIMRQRSGCEPGVHSGGGIGVDFISHNIGEDGQMIAPALDMVIASGGIGEFVDQVQAGAGHVRFQPEGDEGSSWRDHFPAGVPVSKHDELGRPHLQHFSSAFTSFG